MEFIKTKLSESSTWRGLVALATALGLTLSPELSDAIVAAGLGLIGVINVIIKEKKK